MSYENKRAKPDFPLIGEDGNIFHLVGIAAKTLKRNGMSAEATEMSEKVFNSGSYEEALSTIGKYVNITSFSFNYTSLSKGCQVLLYNIT